MPDINARIVLRRGTIAQWTAANPVLLNGEPGWETDTGRFRIGDGVAAFLSLPSYLLEADVGAAQAAADAAIAAQAAAEVAATAFAALDGLTATATELNALDGVTATGTALVRAANAAAARTAAGVPTITVSAAAPTGGADGDLWFQY